MKTCWKCKKSLPKSSFGSDRSKKEGLSGMCKKCGYKKIDERRKKSGYFHSQKYRDKFRKDGKTTYQNRKVALEKYSKENPEKIKARGAVRYALKQGKLKKEPCAICGEKKVHAHHYAGYEKENWLAVSWLCQKHHNQSHYEQN